MSVCLYLYSFILSFSLCRYLTTVCFLCLITDNKSLNNTDSNSIKPKVWVETDHHRTENVIDVSENFIMDGNNEVGIRFVNANYYALNSCNLECYLLELHWKW